MSYREDEVYSYEVYSYSDMIEMFEAGILFNKNGDKTDLPSDDVQIAADSLVDSILSNR